MCFSVRYNLIYVSGEVFVMFVSSKCCDIDSNLLLHNINKLPYCEYNIFNIIKDTKCASIHPKKKYNQSYCC